MDLDVKGCSRILTALAQQIPTIQQPFEGISSDINRGFFCISRIGDIRRHQQSPQIPSRMPFSWVLTCYTFKRRQQNMDR